MTPSRDPARLIEIMAALRTPGTGCAWDLAQTFESLVPYAIEEAHEVADAVVRGDRDDLRDELGDLLLQVAFQARLAEEEGSFDFGGVVEAITSKLIRRHPHIFGNRRHLTPDEVKRQWDEVKAAEKAERARREEKRGRPANHHLSDVPASLPALPRATRLQVEAAKVGFDWNDPRLVLAKIREEVDEAEAALDDEAALEGEIGDLIFAVVNLARHARIDPETALHAANRKFERRFGHIEQELRRQGSSLETASLDEMERLWRQAKDGEAEPRPGRHVAT